MYASANLPTHEGFGLAIIPYLIYLSLYKKELKRKHFLVTIFFGINTDLLFGGFAVPSIILVIFLIIDKNQIKQFLKIFIIFAFSIILANLNMFYLLLADIEFHRSEILRETHSLKESLLYFFNYLFPVPSKLGYGFLMQLPISLFAIPVIIFSFFSNDKNLKMILVGLILTILFIVVLKSKFIGDFINTTNLKTISWVYLDKSLILLYCLLLIFFLNRNNLYSKILTFLVVLSVLIFQINSSVIPLYKEKILKLDNYQNFYTFKGFYSFYDYKKIKAIVKNNRVLSVGLDPMVAVKNNIFVIDGYHSIYPLSYKKNLEKL